MDRAAQTSPPDSAESGGGVSPLAQPDLSFSDDWNYHYFLVVPLTLVKHYNHEPVTRMIHRAVLEGVGSFDPQAFPPPLESWANPVSLCVKLHCTRKVFDDIRAKVLDIYTTFGGSQEMLLYYQTSGAMQ